MKNRLFSLVVLVTAVLFTSANLAKDIFIRLVPWCCKGFCQGQYTRKYHIRIIHMAKSLLKIILNCENT